MCEEFGTSANGDDADILNLLDDLIGVYRITLPETNSSPLKMDGFGVLEDDPFPLGLGLFSGAMLLFFGGRVHTPKLT